MRGWTPGNVGSTTAMTNAVWTIESSRPNHQVKMWAAWKAAT
jgi:hypothetical protein